MDTDEAIEARIVGQTVGGRWRLERLLGTGGMAAVYAARDASGNVAAIKILHPEMSRRHDVRERFLREAYVANRIAHPGAVQVLEHSADESGSTYLVMELLEGEPLSTRVRRLGRLEVDELVDYLDQILDVLIHAHDQGVIHRDLKPDNLFVTNEGRIKILDFGLARMMDDVPGDFKTRTGMALGTLPYMAPEQALGRRNEIDGRVDLFALGATAFRILAGRKVHEADSEAELLIAMASKPAPPLASVAPDAPSGLCAVVDLSLAFSRDARYPDARTMQADVRAVRQGQPPPYATSRSAAREESTRLDMPAVTAAAIAAAPGGVPARTHDPATAPTAPAPVSPLARTSGGTAVLPQMPPATASPDFATGGQAPPRGTTPAPGSLAAAPASVPGAPIPDAAAAGPASMPGSAGAAAVGPGSRRGAVAAGPASVRGTAVAAAPAAIATAGSSAMGLSGTMSPGTAAAPPAAARPAPAKQRSLVPWVLAGAVVLLLIAGAVAAAAFYWVEKGGGALPRLELPSSSAATSTSSAPPALTGAGGATGSVPGAAPDSAGGTPATEQETAPAVEKHPAPAAAPAARKAEAPSKTRPTTAPPAPAKPPPAKAIVQPQAEVRTNSAIMIAPSSPRPLPPPDQAANGPRKEPHGHGKARGHDKGHGH